MAGKDVIERLKLAVNHDLLRPLLFLGIFAKTGKGSMNSRAGNSTALKRLMTEYRQLTAGGMILASRSFDGSIDVGLYILQDLQMGCLQLVCVNYANFHSSMHQLISQGPISESDFFTWEALICGPKDTPFVSTPPCVGIKQATVLQLLALT